MKGQLAKVLARARQLALSGRVGPKERKRKRGLVGPKKDKGRLKLGVNCLDSGSVFSFLEEVKGYSFFKQTSSHQYSIQASFQAIFNLGKLAMVSSSSSLSTPKKKSSSSTDSALQSVQVQKPQEQSQKSKEKPLQQKRQKRPSIGQFSKVITMTTRRMLFIYIYIYMYENQI